jgi:hypothetical protein
MVQIASLIIPFCDVRTPFGFPVEPDVKNRIESHIAV